MSDWNVCPDCGTGRVARHGSLVYCKGCGCAFRVSPQTGHADKREAYANDFDTFTAEAKARLEAGEAEYGNRNMDHATPAELGKEAREELLDIVNYTFMLSRRIDAWVKKMEG